MGAQRERRHEDTQERTAATAPAPAQAVPPTAGLSPQTLNRAGVIALQRLVGNAAVAGMMQARERPGEQEASDAQEVGDPAADLSPAPGAGDGAASSELLAGAGAIAGLEGALAGEASNGSGPETAADLAGIDTGATVIEANGTAPSAAGATVLDAEHAEESAGTDDAGAQPDGAVGDGAGADGAVGAGGGAPAAAGGPVAAGGAAAAGPAAATASPAAAGGAVGAAEAPGAVAAPGPPAASGAAGPSAAPAAPAGPAGPAEAGDVRDPHDDPKFKAMKGATKSAGARTKTHQPAAAGAATAQGAAAPPGNEVASKAAAAQVDEMGKQQPGVFDKTAFIAAVKKAIDAAAPKNLEEADDFKGSGKAAKAKDEVQGLVKGGKKESEKNIKQATDAPPDTSKATPKTVTPMVNDDPGPPPAGVGAAAAMPGPRPPEQTDLSAGPAQVDATMAAADVTDEQIKKSNEPEFGGVLEARDAAKQHAATAPAEYRSQEQGVLAKGRADAEGAAGEQFAGMQGVRAKSLDKVLGQKGETKGADESKRAKVAADIQAIYDKTKGDVTKILEALDGKVDAAFTKGEQAARTQFETYVDEQMRAYKADRYDGWTGGLKWAKDKLFGMPRRGQPVLRAGARGVPRIDGRRHRRGCDDRRR